MIKVNFGREIERSKGGNSGNGESNGIKLLDYRTASCNGRDAVPYFYTFGMRPSIPNCLYHESQSSIIRRAMDSFSGISGRLSFLNHCPAASSSFCNFISPET